MYFFSQQNKGSARGIRKGSLLRQHQSGYLLQRKYFLYSNILRVFQFLFITARLLEVDYFPYDFNK